MGPYGHFAIYPQSIKLNLMNLGVYQSTNLMMEFASSWFNVLFTKYICGEDSVVKWI